MMQRCYKPYAPNYKYYGGRGITVCKRWHKFENFYADMGDAPPGLSLDREKVNEPYSKNNCRWATREEQARNRRDNVNLTHLGRTQTQTEWERELGFGKDGIGKRLRRGWPVERAFAESTRR